MKHIVHIIPALPFGGAERCVVDLVNHSDPSPWRYTIIVFFNNNALAKEIIHPDVQVIIVPKKGKVSYHLFRDLQNKFRELKPDMVHTHLFTPDLWGRLAAKSLGLPVVTTEHNLNYGDGWLKNTIKKYLRHKSDYYLACSANVKQYMIDSYKIKDDKIKVCHYGIDLSRFKNLAAPAFSEPIKFLILGRLSQQKGHGTVLRALAGLKQLNWRLHIVGQGELEQEIKNLIVDLKLTDRVALTEPTHDVPQVLAQADIMLVPSLWEGLGIVAMEAMAAGRLVVGSRTGGLPELIKDNQTGFLVEPKSVQAWQEKISWCLNNLADCQRVAGQGREYARQNFGVEKMVKVYEDTYNRLSE